MNVYNVFCPDLHSAHGTLFLQLKDGYRDPKTPLPKFKHYLHQTRKWKRYFLGLAGFYLGQGFKSRGITLSLTYIHSRVCQVRNLLVPCSYAIRAS